MHRAIQTSKHPISGDSSSRCYYRTQGQGRSAVLMEVTGAPVPGHDSKDFVRIGAWLRESGLHAPEIYEVRGNNILMEDFGDTSCKAALAQGVPPQDVYRLAVDVLIRLRETPCALDLPDYYDSHVHKGRSRLVGWYMPVVLGRSNSDGLLKEYLDVWEGIEKSLPPCPQGFLHIDYHVENLMWIEGSRDVDKCGILDFQGAMRGPLPYDLANLLEDARIDVAPDLRVAMINRYCAGMTKPQQEIFMNWYRVLATQFHCRVAGQFIKLALRHDKPDYLRHMPRLESYLREGLEHPVLKPLKEWCAAQQLYFEAAFSVEKMRENEKFIAPDAF